MSKVTLYGSSDDLVELAGDISEEWGYGDGDEAKGVLVAFSDGTVLRIRYGDESDGVWRIVPVTCGSAELSVEQCADPGDGDGDYTDRATLTGDIRWAVLGSDIARVARPRS